LIRRLFYEAVSAVEVTFDQQENGGGGTENVIVAHFKIISRNVRYKTEEVPRKPETPTKYHPNTNPMR
jgi:hypothetical protein